MYYILILETKIIDNLYSLWYNINVIKRDYKIKKDWKEKIMSLIKNERVIHNEAKRVFWNQFDKLRMERYEKEKEASQAVAAAFGDMVEAIKATDPNGKGLTALEIEQLTNGDFSKYEVAGLLCRMGRAGMCRYTGAPSYRPDAKKVTIKREEVVRRFVELKEDGTVNMNSSITLHNSRNRYIVK